MRIEFNDLTAGDVSIGVYSLEGQEYDGREFYELVFGFFLFNVCLTFYRE